MTSALLLFAHGARDSRWAEPFEAVAARLRRSAPETAVELAYLEFMTPSLGEAARRLAAAGCDPIDIVPLFLGAGGHVRNDLPPLVDALRAEFPAVRWRLHPPVGEAPQVVDALAAASLALARAP